MRVPPATPITLYPGETMEAQVLELIEVVKAGIPVVAEQAVRAQLIHLWVGIICASIIGLVAGVICLTGVRLFYKDGSSKYTYTMDHDLEGIALCSTFAIQSVFQVFVWMMR